MRRSAPDWSATRSLAGGRTWMPRSARSTRPWPPMASDRARFCPRVARPASTWPAGRRPSRANSKPPAANWRLPASGRPKWTLASMSWSAKRVERSMWSRARLPGSPTTRTWRSSGSFDLLVIDDAHQLAEPDFVAAARLAPRWILIGEPVGSSGGQARRSAGPVRPADRGAATRGLGPRWPAARVPAAPGARARPPATGVRAGGRRGRHRTPPVYPAGERPDAGRSGIPGSVHPAGGSRVPGPRVIGSHLPAADPHRYMGDYRQWPVVRFGASERDAVLAEIGPGIREELVGLETRAVHFAADWSIERAKEWAAENIGRRESGRVAVLSHPYRACPGLAAMAEPGVRGRVRSQCHCGRGAARRVPGGPGHRPAAARTRPARHASAGPVTKSTWATRASGPPSRRSCATCPRPALSMSRRHRLCFGSLSRSRVRAS